MTCNQGFLSEKFTFFFCKHTLYFKKVTYVCNAQYSRVATHSEYFEVFEKLRMTQDSSGYCEFYFKLWLTQNSFVFYDKFKNILSFLDDISKDFILDFEKKRMMI